MKFSGGCLACRSFLLLFMMQVLHRSIAWIPQSRLPTTMLQRSLIYRTFSSRGDLEVDEQGRRIRRSSGGWDDFDPLSVQEKQSKGAWDDFDPMEDVSQRVGSKTSSQNRSDGRNRTDGRSKRNRRPGVRREKTADDRKINLKALDGAGFVHLYGLPSVLNALKANRRDFTRPEALIDMDMLSGEELQHEQMQRARKPEAQFTPWLFVQERSFKGGRNADKALAAEQVEELANERDIPIARVDKGVLNTLSGNRPHQGYVLRCGALSFEHLSRIPLPPEGAPNLWLILDEVVDPQNLGALLRSAYFLGGSDIGILVCSKNSAPPSPVVSAASAGALELVDVWSTSNLPRTLNTARDDGFRIIGASSSVPPGEGATLYNLQELPKDDRPTLLVLGSEGSGLRTLVARACTDFVRIPGASEDEQEGAAGVDSLNVSVTGGVLLWHMLQQLQQ